MSYSQLTLGQHKMRVWDSNPDRTDFTPTLFFFFFFFLGPHPWHMEGPRLGVQLELQPQPLGIQATSVTYTTAPGNAGSLTH